MDFAAGHALAVNSVLGQLLCKEKNSCTPGVQERGGYPVGKMPTLTCAHPVACFERGETMLSPLESGMLSLASSRSCWGSSTGLSSNSADSHNSQREGHLPT